VATVASRNRAGINTAYFAYSDELELFFYSYPDSQHAKNLNRNPSMATTIFSSAQTWGKPDRGMQLFGTCREASQKLTEKAEEVYGKRFPDFKKWKAALKKDEGEFLLRPYRFLPRRVKILDESVFGAGVFVVASISVRQDC
jgi:uncharacterized protein YhbP (UPF0306 family)